MIEFSDGRSHEFSPEGCDLEAPEEIEDVTTEAEVSEVLDDTADESKTRKLLKKPQLKKKRASLRYHSSGFIAEFAIKITRSPEEIIDDTTGGVE